MKILIEYRGKRLIACVWRIGYIYDIFSRADYKTLSHLFPGLENQALIVQVEVVGDIPRRLQTWIFEPMITVVGIPAHLFGQRGNTNAMAVQHSYNSRFMRRHVFFYRRAQSTKKIFHGGRRLIQLGFLCDAPRNIAPEMLHHHSLYRLLPVLRSKNTISERRQNGRL